MKLRLAELCAGYGGLHQAAAMLWPVQLAWYAENDPDASTVMAAHHPGVPNLGDITAVDWRRAEPVDILAAGYPCTDLSNAGRRAGIDGVHSGIWRDVADAVRVLRPRVVLLENVAAHLARGFGRVLGDLAQVGYDARWMCLRASDLGAPHQRDRVFILATPSDTDGERVRLEPVPIGARSGSAVAGGNSKEPGLTLLPTPTDRGSAGRGQPSPKLAGRRYAQGRRMLDDAVALLPTPRGSEGAKGGPNQRGSSGDLTLTSSVMLLPTPTAMDANGSRNATLERPPSATTNVNGWTLHDVAYADRWAQYGPAIARWEAILGRTAPEPTVVGKRGGRRLSARFVEWLMGLPDGWVTDVVGNTPALRICGNGVVPLQGATAFHALAVAA